MKKILLSLIILSTLLYCQPKYPHLPIARESWQMKEADTNSTVNQSLLKGNLSLIFFGYTTCPDICPMTFLKFARVFKKHFPKNKQIPKVIFINLDYENQQPKILKNYSTQFGYPITGLFGNKSQIDKITSSFKVNYEIKKSKKGYRLIDHSTIVFLVDKKGSVRHIFHHDSTEEEYYKVLKDFI